MGHRGFSFVWESRGDFRLGQLKNFSELPGETYGNRALGLASVQGRQKRVTVDPPDPQRVR